MTIESALFELLGALVGKRCYPDITPSGADFPLIVYQAVGGESPEFLERRLPDCEHYRIQVHCWAKTRLQASSLALQVRQQIIEHGMSFVSAKTLGQRIALYEEELKLYGTRQDFGIWIKER
ncbi:DUF3168 domain-containing protein [Alcaligenes phenolicus]|uniref:DUF3168 domain-containing protein n=1 Tax=Alcaligenes phenolicus TaxID=232846 RepID=UPI002B8034AC|nr:DUF3168 domain-containing protein [Alcaligenes phenolicus]HRO20820.1 DUF3168 domain-containing protein [Alcaligenes phenolicus]HRP13652.1 DUF3168 domain-containing protein [Alcaligenes phenolicus]